MTFYEKFEKLTGKHPFPWQEALYARFLGDDIPDVCHIPTGLGKTSVIAIWLIALSQGGCMPRRLVYVVNRRTVVDQTTNEVVRLRQNAHKIGIHNLAISTLRGQFADNQEWSSDPSRPAIICGTVERIKESSFMPVNALSDFQLTGYARANDTEKRPFAVFELRHDDGSFNPYPQRQLVHISGMVRHLAKELMLQSPPSGVEPDWVERYVAGHRKEGDPRHRQFSYLPLPSIGHQHADQLVRRVMICAPPGENSWLEHLAKRIAGHRLKPERRDAFGKNGPPTLVHIQSDNMVRSYTRATNKWASVTPVILPGHDDRKPAKTRRLIGSALAQSGIRQHCEFEWSPFSHFRKSLSAHKYDKDKQPTGYIRPDHLMTLTAVHLKLRFKNELNFPGPLSIGAGRHCGLGIFAGVAA